MLKRSLLVVATILLVVSGCSDDDDPDGSAAPTTEEDTTTSSTGEACEADDADATELEALIPGDVPEGFEAQPDSVGDTGPSDLAKAVRDDGGDDAEQVLTDLRFRRGYQRLWQSEEREQLIVFLYEFCEPTDAEDYIDRAVRLFSAPETELEEFEAGAPADHGFRGESPEDGAYVSVIAAEGAYAVQVVAFSPPGTSPADELPPRATDLLRVQLEALD